MNEAVNGYYKEFADLLESHHQVLLVGMPQARPSKLALYFTLNWLISGLIAANYVPKRIGDIGAASKLLDSISAFDKHAAYKAIRCLTAERILTRISCYTKIKLGMLINKSETGALDNAIRLAKGRNQTHVLLMEEVTLGNIHDLGCSPLRSLFGDRSAIPSIIDKDTGKDNLVTFPDNLFIVLSSLDEYQGSVDLLQNSFPTIDVPIDYYPLHGVVIGKRLKLDILIREMNSRILHEDVGGRLAFQEDYTRRVIAPDIFQNKFTEEYISSTEDFRRIFKHMVVPAVASGYSRITGGLASILGSLIAPAIDAPLNTIVLDDAERLIDALIREYPKAEVK